MAITIVEERKTQKYLAIVFGVLVVVIVFVLLSRFVKKEEVVIPPLLPQKPYPKIEIKFQVLNNPVLDQLTEPFPELPSISLNEFKGMIGKENPFSLPGVETGEGVGQ